MPTVTISLDRAVNSFSSRSGIGQRPVDDEGPLLERRARRGARRQHPEIVHRVLPGRNPGSIDVNTSAVVRAAGDQGLTLSTAPMKEMVQPPFTGGVGLASGLFDELRHLTRLGDKGRVGAIVSPGQSQNNPVDEQSCRRL
jgi:hypothetical protein